MNRLDRCFVKEKDLVTRCVAGETIIVPVRSNVGDLNSIYTLNEIGTMIWQLIDCKKSVSQIVEAVCKVYDVKYEEAKNDTLDFLHSLEAAALIRPAVENKG